ncbi:MAG: hypothetical protein JNL94_18515 [Planctomycetes bacterium]|nr:hypothetical protein [Planctomycetota bacterium]
MTGSRTVSHVYEDPLDRIWTATAERIGFRIVRGSDVYASYDGAGTLTIGTPETLDADDCLAQMIFHECCHALVQGRDALRSVDFGLDNRTGRDDEREHACLVTQAILASRHGLREFLAPTTDYRAFWNGLGDDPRAGCTPTVGTLVAAALRAAALPPFAPHLEDALAATAAIVRLARPFTTESIEGPRRSLYDPTR